MNRTAARRTRWQLLSQILCWIVSLAALGSGIALFLYGKSITVASSVWANEGTITDATEYYQKATSGSSSITLGSALIAVAILGIILTLALFAHPWGTVAAGSVEAPAIEAGSENTAFDESVEDGEESASEGTEDGAGTIGEVSVPDLTETNGADTRK